MSTLLNTDIKNHFKDEVDVLKREEKDNKTIKKGIKIPFWLLGQVSIMIALISILFVPSETQFFETEIIANLFLAFGFIMLFIQLMRSLIDRELSTLFLTIILLCIWVAVVLSWLT